MDCYGAARDAELTRAAILAAGMELSARWVRGPLEYGRSAAGAGVDPALIRIFWRKEELSSRSSGV